MLQVITITGMGDHHRLDQPIAITGIRRSCPMMQCSLLALAMLAGLVLNAPAAHAGLVEYVYHNIPATAYTPTDASISAVQANAAAAKPNYSFVNTADTFNYNGGGSQTNTFFGADAAGAAATDTASIDQFAFDAKGVLNISVAGNLTIHQFSSVHG